ncbi:MAG: hypothetical protein U5L09_08760 [Bacteroidales bacterium]|nr:hypothetical protein [Bacteroidales bacterium]
MINVKLYVIGVVQDPNVYKELKKHELVKNRHVIFITDSEYTAEASKMLYLADAVIGSGRGLMEAASLKKPVLAINKNGDVPVLLNDSYFSDAFKTNFSERNIFPELDGKENLNNIAGLIQDKYYYNEISTFAFNCFNKYFNLNKVEGEYINVYKKSSISKRYLFEDSLIILKSFYHFFIGAIKN